MGWVGFASWQVPSSAPNGSRPSVSSLLDRLSSCLLSARPARHYHPPRRSRPTIPGPRQFAGSPPRSGRVPSTPAGIRRGFARSPPTHTPLDACGGRLFGPLTSFGEMPRGAGCVLTCGALSLAPSRAPRARARARSRDWSVCEKSRVRARDVGRCVSAFRDCNGTYVRYW